jgi:hypothetical protein
MISELARFDQFTSYESYPFTCGVIHMLLTIYHSPKHSLFVRRSGTAVTGKMEGDRTGTWINSVFEK